MGQLKKLNEQKVVVTSIYITELRMPILYVSYDFDEEDIGNGILQFHSGNGDYDIKKMQLVQLKTIFQIDKSIGILNLEIGEEATRTSLGSNWLIKKPDGGSL